MSDRIQPKDIKINQIFERSILRSNYSISRIEIWQVIEMSITGNKWYVKMKCEDDGRSDNELPDDKWFNFDQINADFSTIEPYYENIFIKLDKVLKNG
jgi:hypothetical protein